MINKIFLTLSFLSVSAIAFAQAKKPTLMVIPTEAWCYENDFSYEVNNQGRKTRITDYEKAFQESSDLLNATTVHQQAGCRSPRHRLAVTIGRNPATITGSGCSQYG